MREIITIVDIPLHKIERMAFAIPRTQFFLVTARRQMQARFIWCLERWRLSRCPRNLGPMALHDRARGSVWTSSN
jgi:hypothetical protein